MATTVILSNGREVVFSDELSDEEIYRRAKQMDEQQMREQQPMLANPNAVQPRSTITGMTPDEAQARASAGLEAAKPALALGARIVGPVAAGVLAPAAIPAGIAGATAVGLTSLIGAGAGATSEFVAQTIEQLDKDRVEYDPNAITAATIAGLAPMKTTGSLAARTSTNVGSALGTSELSRFIAMGKDAEGNSRYTPFEEDVAGYGLRYGVPLAFAGLASAAGSTAARSKEAQANIARVQSERGPNATVALSEAIPDFAETERAAYARQSLLADEIISNLDAPIGPKIESYFKDIPDIAPIREDLMAKRDLLTQLQDDYNLAKSNYSKAASEAANARAASGRDAPSLVAKAELAGFQETAARVKLLDTVTKQLKGIEGRSLDSVSAAVRDNNVRGIVSAADNHMKAAIKDAYKLAGYENNTPVVSMPDIFEEIDLLGKNPQSHLSNNLIRKQMKEIVESYVMANNVDGNKLDLLKFRQLRNSSRDALVASGMSEGDARSVASDAYDAVARAANRYIKRTNASYFPAWEAAQSLARSHFVAQDTPAYQLITADPKLNAQISDTLYQSIKEGGKASQAAQDFRKIATTIAASYDKTDPFGQRRAIEAADIFVRNLNTSLADAALSQSRIIGKGVRKGLDAFSLDKLASELDALDSVGFKPEQLGIGTSGMIRSLARVFDLSKTTKTVTQKELNDFLDAAAVIGGDRAAWKLDYQRAVRDNLIAAGAKEKGQTAARMTVAAKKAGITLRDAEKALVDARNDPLVRMFEDSNFKLASDPANNGNWVGKILTMPKESITRLVNAFRDRGDFESLENLRIAAAANIMRQYESSVEGVVPRAKLKELHEFFYKSGNDNDEIRRRFIALVGNDEYSNLERTFGRPIKNIVEVKENIMDATKAGRLAGLSVRQRQNAGDRKVNVTAYADLKSITDMLRNGRYNTIYKMYVDPKWAPKVAAASGELASAISRNPTLGTILNLSRSRDERNRDGQQTNSTPVR